MEASPRGFANRCLPLLIANQHGWEILTPEPFSLMWDGGETTEAIQIKRSEGTRWSGVNSHFGCGVVTFNLGGIFRTDAGYDLMVTGPPNRPKDGIYALTGMVETDWLPFGFTMNWKMTRPHWPVSFSVGEPFCFVYPVRRGALEKVKTRRRPLSDQPAFERQVVDWTRDRAAFIEKLRTTQPPKGRDWQKNYMRGERTDGSRGMPTHKTGLKLMSFKD